MCKEAGKYDWWSGIKIIAINGNNPEMVRMMKWVDIINLINIFKNIK